jgi:DNA polymerase-3 subunit delta
MLLFLYGADTFRSRQKLNEILAKFKKVDPAGMNLVTLDMSEQKFADFIRAVGALPFMAKSRLVVVKNLLAEGNARDQAAVLAMLVEKKIPTSTTVVFFEYQSVDKRTKEFKQLKKLTRAQEFEVLPEWKLNKWIRDEVSRRGGKIAGAAVDKLAAFVGNDLWRLNNELEKLLAYSRGRPITADSVALLAKANLDENIFHLVDAIGRGRSGEALSLLHENLALGKNEQYLLAMIAFQFRNLAQVVPLIERGWPVEKIKQELGLHPFVLRKTLAQAKNFTTKKIQRVYDKLVRADLAMKTGKIDPRVALDLLVVGVSK